MFIGCIYGVQSRYNVHIPVFCDFWISPTIFRNFSQYQSIATSLVEGQSTPLFYLRNKTFNENWKDPYFHNNFISTVKNSSSIQNNASCEALLLVLSWCKVIYLAWISELYKMKAIKYQFIDLNWSTQSIQVFRYY